jgi:hypothetical protein
LIAYLPELPDLTNDLQASKSIAKSATCPAGTVMFTFIFRPLCWPLGVVSSVSALPVGLIEFASMPCGDPGGGLLPSTRRICV